MGQSSSAIKQSSNMQSLKSVLLLLVVLKFAATATLSRSNTWPPRINPQTQPTLPRRQGSLRLKYQINSSSVRMPVVTFTQDQDIAINITSAVTEFLPNFTYSRVPMVSTSTQHPNSAS